MSPKSTANLVKEPGNTRTRIWDKNTKEYGHMRYCPKYFRTDVDTIQETICFFKNNVPKLILHARRAFEFVSLRDDNRNADHCDYS